MNAMLEQPSTCRSPHYVYACLTRRSLHFLLITAALLLVGCGTFVTDSAIKPYKLESYEPLGDAQSIKGVSVSSSMSPKRNHVYDRHGPFSLSIICEGMKGTSKVVAIRSLEVARSNETLFSRQFTSLRGDHSDHRSEKSVVIDGVYVASKDRLAFSFRDLFTVEHFPGEIVAVRVVVELNDGGTTGTKELVFRHRATTKRGVWQWYPPT